MSIELHIFMQDSQVPTRAAWQQAIEHLSLPAVLDKAFDVRQWSGFLPTTCDGKPSGFEFSLAPAEEIIEAYPHIAAQVVPRDTCATFIWGGDIAEMRAALSAAAALVKLTDGVWFDPQDDIAYTAGEAVAATRKDLASS